MALALTGMYIYASNHWVRHLQSQLQSQQLVYGVQVQWLGRRGKGSAHH